MHKNLNLKTVMETHQFPKSTQTWQSWGSFSGSSTIKCSTKRCGNPQFALTHHQMTSCDQFVLSTSVRESNFLREKLIERSPRNPSAAARRSFVFEGSSFCIQTKTVNSRTWNLCPNATGKKSSFFLKVSHNEKLMDNYGMSPSLGLTGVTAQLEKNPKNL